MAPQTEAACLLESGALYGVRIMLRPLQGPPIFAGFKQGAFSLYYGDEPIYHFDREGRWQRAYHNGVHYLKGLDTTVQSIDRVREGQNLVLKRRTLPYAEASDLDAAIRATALDLIETLGSDRLERVDPPSGKATPLSSESLRDFLERVADWDSAAWFAHREKYLATYGPLPFLPPDSQNALVLQATLGHAGGVAFGGGAAAPYYQRSTSEFATHIREVAKLYGQRLVQYRNLFLAGSDVLRRPIEETAAYLETIARTQWDAESGRRAEPQDEFSTPPRLESVHAFLDDFTTSRYAPAEWRTLRDLHLRRVILGVESGDPTVRAAYGKDWANDALAATVADLKEAELGVSLVVLVGAGGVEQAERHLAATADLINALALGTGDLVALVDANEVCDPSQASLGFTPLVGAGWSDQLAAFKEALRPVKAERGAKVVPYSLEKQGH